MNVKGLNLEKYGNPDSGLYDKLIFNKIKIGVGLDKCKVIISGSAPLLPSTYKFIRILLPGLEILEGYGLTESTGGVSVTRFGRGREGTKLASSNVRRLSLLVYSPSYSHILNERSKN